ncbi:transcriptional regulator [Pseudorhodoferax aquiterrae]|uniref:Transcriptional regulator n=1 Tax=Pseudorhodoferax aquiterrae TaxID=747304 RepID=A0ABQ3FVB3_9BURK|nr:GntR family transcriptional regulator [Pseudorhodoferax aquiterrae]GHC70338.1 transcriptional regulator [Pseudorhodoferax aquiterrae]
MSRHKNDQPPPNASGDTEATEAASGTQPIYQRIAAELRRGIAEGRYPVGARLPTEIELCEQFGISRFTARAAIRLLSTAGLVTRRQRVGTVVIAEPGQARYRHDATSLPDLLQYAQDTELRIVYVGRIALSRSQAQDFGTEAGEEWVLAVGLRHDQPGAGGARKAPPPFCITRIFLNPMLKDIEARLRERQTAVYALIEREYKLSIQRVEQEIQGVVLSADDAASLQSEPGAPALRIVRRYYSDSGDLVEVADNVHPSDRFSYRMELRQ